VEIRTCDFETSAAGRAGWPPEGPPEVAFAGRSNVGKSSLINTLCARRGLAQTSATPGKTRLINFFRVVPVDGPEVRFVDLPGYGYAKVARSERHAFEDLVGEYVRRRSSLCAVVALVDPRREPGEEEGMLLEWLGAAGRPAIVVVTKIDKLARHERRPALARVRAALGLGRDPLPFSARTREGRDVVWERIVVCARSPRSGATPPPAGSR
jgi:GTP-binding protein